MNYKKILKQLANKNNVTVKEIENEMKFALISAGLNCSVKEFIELTVTTLSKRLYIVD